MSKKYFRKDKSRSDILNKLCVDECFYIEEKIDKFGREYYLMVEEYKSVNYKRSYRIKNDVARHRIYNGLFIEKD